MSIENPNSTDATTGMNLRTRVEMRRSELQSAVGLATSESEKSDLTIALGEVDMLMTGDLDNIPAVVGVELNRWLEANKHLAEYHHVPTQAVADPSEGLIAD